MTQKSPRRAVPGAALFLFFLCVALVAACAQAHEGHTRVQAPAATADLPAVGMARGVVFHDRDGDRVRDAGEEGLPGVRVSNGRYLTRTNSRGEWQLEHDDDTIFFVIKPRGWMTPLSEDMLPRFYYLHKPHGSPPDLAFPGVAPTGPLPESIDFPLTPQAEPDRFKAIFFGDTQPRDQREVDYITHDVLEGLAGTDASFGVTLGDIVFNDLSVMEPLNRAIAMVGIPWYNVLGNHDINFDVPDDHGSTATFERIYGPPYYSFDYGPTHFIVLDDVRWLGHKQFGGENRYVGGLGPEQIEFVRRDLQLVPRDQLVVLMMHIPLVNVEDRQELYRLIEQRPYALSISGHTHWQQHVFIDEKGGWQGAEPHHHVVNVTVCGSWWTGAPDELGIPHTTMRDGAPNGHSVFTFDGHTYTIDFVAARRPAEYQMNIDVPEVVKADETAEVPVFVNVFNGSERSSVEMRVGPDGAWVPLEKVLKLDPAFQRVYEREQKLEPPYRGLSAPVPSHHLWEGRLPADLPPGLHAIQVRTTDMFGRSFTALRGVRVE